ncbi:GGDEF domain-containing protein [Actinomadura scrupuli]|uniref:GGDEF domain-containing protein n=1 Tax=Actinomadura scrupuli TaxID=559629 RepID=UPI003D969571
MIALIIITEGAALWLAFRLGQNSKSGKASLDDLTGLPNRRALEKRLKREKSGHWVLLLLDLNEFKPVNDQHGHGTGDELLKVVAGRLRAVGSDCPVYRLGGDEFVTIAGPYSTSEEAEHAGLELARDIAQAIAEPITLGGGIVAEVTASIGIAEGVRSYARLGDADAAMYLAKELYQGGNPPSAGILFRPGMIKKITPVEPTDRRRFRHARRR